MNTNRRFCKTKIIVTSSVNLWVLEYFGRILSLIQGKFRTISVKLEQIVNGRNACLNPLNHNWKYLKWIRISKKYILKQELDPLLLLFVSFYQNQNSDTICIKRCLFSYQVFTMTRPVAVKCWGSYHRKHLTIIQQYLGFENNKYLGFYYWSLLNPQQSSKKK